ncbi:MAG: class II aldolase/adducin family protein, partial [Planctomycetota bacterium]|nr:class II aldolase/adducin family protein [Planctomycetota bacterium]
MLEELKERVCRANLRRVADGLVVMTWGNVSGVDRKAGLVVIKPSGLSYADMGPERMVVVSLADGKIVEGTLRPSSDTATHLELYRAWKDVGGIVHTHSL